MIKFQPSNRLGDGNSPYQEEQAKGPRVCLSIPGQYFLAINDPCPFVSMLGRRGVRGVGTPGT